MRTLSVREAIERVRDVIVIFVEAIAGGAANVYEAISIPGGSTASAGYSPLRAERVVSAVPSDVIE